MKIQRITPCTKHDDFLSRFSSFSPAVISRTTDFLEVRFSDGKAPDLWVEIDTEFSVFFADWHCHYFADEEEYKVFIEELEDILTCRRFAICAYSGGRIIHSCLSYPGQKPDKTGLSQIAALSERRDMNDIIVKCTFRDPSMNVVFSL